MDEAAQQQVSCQPIFVGLWPEPTLEGGARLDRARVAQDITRDRGANRARPAAGERIDGLHVSFGARGSLALDLQRTFACELPNASEKNLPAKHE